MAEYGMEVSSNRRKILVNSVKPAKTIYQHTDEQANAGRSGPAQVLRLQTKDGTSVKEVNIRLAQGYSAVTRLALLWKNKAIGFQQRLFSIGHLSCRFFSMDVRAGH